MNPPIRLFNWSTVMLCALVFAAGTAGLLPAADGEERPVTVKVFSLPSKRGVSPEAVAAYRIFERFRQLHPHIRLESSTALQIEGDVQDAAPLMAIAGGTSPDIIYVNFRQSETYIQRGFLHPLDEYVAQMSPEEIADRVPGPVMPVIHREGAGGKHYWAFPNLVIAKVLMYRRDLFAAAGLDPDRPPRNWDELREFARRVADPSKGIYGLAFLTGPHASFGMYSYLCSAGAQAVRQLPNGEWRAAFDSPEAVTAFEFIDDLQKEQVTRNGKTGSLSYRGSDANLKWTDGRVAMMFVSLRGGQLGTFDPQLIGIGPVPTGPTGKASSEVNCAMSGIFAGQKDKRVRDAAWSYIRFMDGPEARQIFTQTLVEQGAWRMLSPKWLRQYGYPELAKLTLPGLEEAYETALLQGTPEPYGKNCQYVYTFMTKPMEHIYFHDFTGVPHEQKRAMIQEFLSNAVRETNEKMIGVIPEPVRKKRNWAAAAIALAVVVSFAFLVRRIFAWMEQGRPPAAETASEHRGRAAKVLIAPALLLILMWQYYPLLRGSLMAFQNYNVMGGSPWVGINNFADVLFDGRFWLSLKNAFYFCALWMTMGFLPPVLLAVMLQEIPVGKIFFRVLFYLPAVVSGIVILFMWRAIYDPSPDGILNKILALVHLPPQKWHNDPKMAMFCIAFPLAWAHLGPGCIIYLAALKGIPDELYEASDIDGASFFGKLRYIVLPYLKPLLVINAVGATIYGFKSGDAVLAMTGGGPNLATHVVGYEIWQRSFLYLQFGHATAMAWVLGVLLLSFTAYQLKILNKVEFRTANR
ncbi:MAG: extracellular solute-binding protein [Verrucomicrobia bacterium]|nr:extracellular solute-binding protein [Verrucomicrobiota bacterium]